MKNILLQPAYVLHRRPYRETSFLVELFTPEHGRLTVVARGIRKAKSTSGLLQPFTPLLVSWMGKAELMTLTHAEANGTVKQLQGECLFAGFYLNELVISLLEKWDPHPGIFASYEKSITALQSTSLEQKILRIFEKYLLEELGYGLLSQSGASLHHDFSPDQYYRFIPEIGFAPSAYHQADANLFLGKNLIGIATDEWENVAVLQDAKRLIRLILTPLLGSKTLHSRKLFAKNT